MSYIDTKKKWNRIVACVMAVILSASMTISPLAAEAVPNTPKEEVVYVNLNTDGSVKEINVVNIFDLDKDGQIVDYGRYESLRNMTTTDKIEYSGDKVTVDAKAGKLYYEGKLSQNVMPWDLSLHYYLDGKEYPAEEIAGKSGALKITMSIRKNPNFSVKISIPLENTGVYSVFATSFWPFSLIFSLARRNEGNFFQAVPTTLSSSLAEVRLASLVAWA